jgi:hypothetical protein
MLNLPIPVKAPLRFLPRGVGGRLRWGEHAVSMAPACEKLSRESWDCVSAVGVSGMSSSSDMGDGMRLLRSSSLGPFQTGGAGMGALLVSMPPAEPLIGYPSPFMPLLLNVGCMGVGMRPLLLLLAESELKSEGWSMAGRMNVPIEANAGDSGGWLRTSVSSSSMSMSKSILLDSLDIQTGPPQIESGEFAPP